MQVIQVSLAHLWVDFRFIWRASQSIWDDEIIFCFCWNLCNNWQEITNWKQSPGQVAKFSLQTKLLSQNLYWNILTENHKAYIEMKYRLKITKDSLRWNIDWNHKRYLELKTENQHWKHYWSSGQVLPC